MQDNHRLERLLAKLELMPPRPGTAVGSALEVWDANEEMIRVSDPTVNPYRMEGKLFDLKAHRYILRYPTERMRSGWTIAIKGDNPSFSVDYAFLDRKSAFDFQRYVTGYNQYAFGENIQCDAIIKSSWPSKDEDYSGNGEIQLWVPAQGSVSDNSGSVLWDTASIASGTATASILAPTISYQSNGATTAFVNESRSPLIMMFLREKDDGRTMLRINLREVKWNLDRRGELEVLTFSHAGKEDKPMKAYRLSVTKTNLDNWDVCTMARNVNSKGIRKIAVMTLSLKIKSESTAVPMGKLSRLEQLEQHLNELGDLLSSTQEPGEQIKHQLKNGINPSEGLFSGGKSGETSYDQFVSPRASIISHSEIVNQLIRPVLELVGDHEPRTPTEMTPIPAAMAFSATSPSSPFHHSHPDRQMSFELSRRDLSVQAPIQMVPNTQRRSNVQARSADNSSESFRHSSGSTDVPSNLRQAFVEEMPLNETEDPSSDEDDATVFTDFDQRVRRALGAEPSTRPATEATLKALHSLPGELRAFLYDFPCYSPESPPDITGSAAEESERASLTSRSETSSGASAKLFRCPFNVANPREHRRGGCKGPGFLLCELGNHLESCHLSYECRRCKKDCLDNEGLDRHAMEEIRCEPVPARESRGIGEGRLRTIKKVLKPSRKDRMSDEERWFCMWELLFPASQERPQPYFYPRPEIERPDLRRIEIVFGEMVESDRDYDGAVVGKERARLYLRAAMQVVENRELGSWPGVLSGAGALQ